MVSFSPGTTVREGSRCARSETGRTAGRGRGTWGTCSEDRCARGVAAVRSGGSLRLFEVRGCRSRGSMIGRRLADAPGLETWSTASAREPGVCEMRPSGSSSGGGASDANRGELDVRRRLGGNLTHRGTDRGPDRRRGWAPSRSSAPVIGAATREVHALGAGHSHQRGHAKRRPRARPRPSPPRRRRRGSSCVAMRLRPAARGNRGDLGRRGRQVHPRAQSLESDDGDLDRVGHRAVRNPQGASSTVSRSIGQLAVERRSPSVRDGRRSDRGTGPRRRRAARAGPPSPRAKPPSTPVRVRRRIPPPSSSTSNTCAASRTITHASLRTALVIDSSVATVRSSSRPRTSAPPAMRASMRTREREHLAHAGDDGRRVVVLLEGRAGIDTQIAQALEEIFLPRQEDHRPIAQPDVAPQGAGEGHAVEPRHQHVADDDHRLRARPREHQRGRRLRGP